MSIDATVHAIENNNKNKTFINGGYKCNYLLPFFFPFPSNSLLCRSRNTRCRNRKFQYHQPSSPLTDLSKQTQPLLDGFRWLWFASIHHPSNRTSCDERVNVAKQIAKIVELGVARYSEVFSIEIKWRGQPCYRGISR